MDFLNKFKGKTVESITLNSSENNSDFCFIKFSDGTELIINAATKDSVFAIQQGYGSYSPILKFTD